MMLTLMILSLSMTIMFIYMKHPMSMGLNLLIQSTLVAMITGLHSLNFWFSYILFMIMVGGMLVLFIYMTSTAANEKFKYSNKMLLMMMMMLMLILILKLIDKSNIMMEINNSEMIPLMNKNLFNLSLNKYLNMPSSMILMFMIIYLLITLIAVVKITKTKYGPIRQKF